MVIQRFLFALIVIALPVSVHAITADDLRSLTADSERENRDRQGRAKTNNVGELVGSDKESVDKSRKSDKIAPKRFKKGQNTDAAAAKTEQKSAPGDDKPKAPAEEFLVSPVPAQQTIVSDAIAKSNAFGIRLGTWMDGKINRNTSSAEPGLVEILLTTDVIGDRKTLRAGTILFAQKQLNAATKRLEMLVVKGITPDGEEFKLTGLVFDTVKVSGLSGIVDVDNDKTMKRGASKGLLAAVGAATKASVGSTPLGSAAEATADSVLQDQRNVVEQTTSQQLTIYVGPQPLLIRVDQSF